MLLEASLIELNNKKTEHMRVGIKSLFGFTFSKPFMLYFLNIFAAIHMPWKCIHCILSGVKRLRSGHGSMIAFGSCYDND